MLRLKTLPPLPRSGARSAFSMALAAGLLAACATGPDARHAGAPIVRVERSRVEMNRDESRAMVIASRLAEADRSGFRAVTVDVFEGRALLLGAVTRPEQRRRAEQITKGMQGVTEVINEIALAEDSSLAAFGANRGLETQLRARVLDDPAVGGAYAIRVVNGVAYLFGRAGSVEEVDHIKAVALSTDGIKWAVNHIKAP